MTFIVHAMGHVQINVTDPDAVIKDATEILGLHVTQRTADQTWLSSNGRAAELVLRHASQNSAHTIGLEALTREAVEAAASRVTEAGCRVLSRTPSLACIDASVTLATPEGLRFEIHTPIRNVLYGRRHATTGVGPNRVDHVNFMTPDPAGMRDRLTHIGGLKLSERMVNDGLSWMYGGNRQHHILGVVKGTVGLHHTSFEFPDFTCYLKLGDLLDRAGKRCCGAPAAIAPATTPMPTTSMQAAR